MKPKQTLPLEKSTFDLEVNGITKKVPALDKTWVDQAKRKFSRYVSHPIPVNGSFTLGEKETWLELMSYIRQDLEWLLQQEHHIFWSHIIYSKDAKQLLVTFLQEAPPYYLRNEFLKDAEMEKALQKIEHLVFLVFARLTTQREREGCYIENLGNLLYDNYIVTVPILLDICLVYGVSNRDFVADRINHILEVAPQYMNDFQEIVPHYLHVLSIVRNKFDNNEILKHRDANMCNRFELSDLLLHLYDSTANIQIFLDVYQKGSRLFREEMFAGEIFSFYSSVIPKIYTVMNRFGDEFNDRIDGIRWDLLSIVRNILCGIASDVFDDPQRRLEHANDYLSKMIEMLQDSLFISDYNRVYPIDTDLRMLREVCQDLDPENLRYVIEAVASLKEELNDNGYEPTDEEMESLIVEVKAILPHLGDSFIEACGRTLGLNSERIIAAVVENRLPPELERLDRGSERVKTQPEPRKPNIRDRIDAETLDLMNDKREVNEAREKFAHLAVVTDDEYDDEYDDTYDGHDVSVRGADDADQERRPFVTPRILRPKEEIEKESEEEEEEEEPNEGRDHFLPNPEEIRAKQEQRRLERMRRDYVGRGRGRGQDKQVSMNRDYKDTHKSSIANHNRRKLASRKRNIPLVHS